MKSEGCDSWRPDRTLCVITNVGADATAKKVELETELYSYGYNNKCGVSACRKDGIENAKPYNISCQLARTLG